MSSRQQPSEQPPDKREQIQEELTAYLDGELNVEARRKVEERLSRDSSYRSELNRLQKAWDLLDTLPRANVGEQFTTTTLEMAAVAAAEEDTAVARPSKAIERRLSWMLAGGSLAALVAGYFIGHARWRSPNEALLRDLTVIENLDAYREVQEIEFLRGLSQEKLFDEGSQRGG